MTTPPSKHERLLVRYNEVATKISTEHAPRPSPKPGPTTHSPENPEPEDGSQVPEAAAVAELLSRQADIVISLHGALAAHPTEAHGIDEDLLKRRIRDLASISTSKFYAYRFDLLPAIWRQIYADTVILESYQLLLRPLLKGGPLSEEVLDVVVEKLDRALITAGGGTRKSWIDDALERLNGIWLEGDAEGDAPCKRKRRNSFSQGSFPLNEPHGRPVLDPEKECPRYSGWTIDQFEDYMNDAGGAPWPIVFTDLMTDWPALTDHPWKSPDYILWRTFGGRRLVPVEIGRSYVDSGWGQELIHLGSFISRYITAPSPRVGYLAQHNLFRQIPVLSRDIRSPDFCWVDVPPHPTMPALDKPKVEAPLLNAWFGPARTITPLHTDAYHNLFCQVVGTKYLRLYPPEATRFMRPREAEHGVDMSNTSGLDVGVLEGWDERPEDVSEEDVERMREELEGVEYRECILGPGDTLVIPIGWWHYVRSLSVSFSVSFWWN